MSEMVRPVVDIGKCYMRKYWNTRRETITVRCRSTTAEFSHQRFRNLFRQFLYFIPPGFEDELDTMQQEDREIAGPLAQYCDWHSAMIALKIDSSVSIQIRAYEKEFFYLKCISKGMKPPVVLRVLLRMAEYENSPEIFTAPETLFQLIHITQRVPILRKDIKFV